MSAGQAQASVSGDAVGATTLTARAGNRRDTASVTVTSDVPPVRTVTLSPDPLGVQVGASGNLTATVATNGTPEPNANVSFSSANAAVASVCRLRPRPTPPAKQWPASRDRPRAAPR